jgi:pimeloyl-ACP methyl ester carboxylesterase
VLEHLFARKDLVSRQLVDDVLKYKRLDGVDEALKKLSSALFSGGRQQAQLGDALRDADIPILVVWGEDDEIIPARHATTLVGKARTHLIGDAGHMVQMEAANAGSIPCSRNTLAPVDEIALAAGFCRTTLRGYVRDAEIFKDQPAVRATAPGPKADDRRSRPH